MLRSKRLLLSGFVILFSLALKAQEGDTVVKAARLLSIEDCRSLAIENNKNLKISDEKVKMAEYDKNAARANYFPQISLVGGYMHTVRPIQLVPDNMLNGLSGLGTSINGLIQPIADAYANDPIAQLLVGLGSELSPTVQALIQTLEGNDIVGTIDAIGKNIADRLSPDVHDIYVGAITVQEPLYVGGKIRAYNRITSYAKELAETQFDTQEQEIIVQTDQAYWQIVSIYNKVKLSEEYVNLLRKLDSDADKLVEQGLATQSDRLAIKVKLNEGEMMLLKAQNGLVLSKMLLCQYIGIDIDSEITLKDESIDEILITDEDLSYTREEVVENRPELHSLDIASKIYEKKVNIVRSEYLPTVALFGTYMMSNPSIFNGLEKQFNGNASFGVMAKIPLFHFLEGVNKIRKAKAEARIMQYELEDKTDLIMLQVNQFEQRVSEADSRLAMSREKLNDAEENLRKATIGFREGILTSTVLTQAQTAWLQAHSELIDATIDRVMTATYLKKAIGKLNK